MSDQQAAPSAPAPDRILTVPNLISFLRLALVPVFAVLLFQGHDLWALGILAFSGATDWLDGWVARRFKQFSHLGSLLDPTADRAFILVTLAGLGYREIVPWWLVILIVAREIVLGFALLVLRHHGYGPMPVHFIGKAATFALLYAFPLLLLGSMSGPIPHLAWTFGWAFAIWGTALYWIGAMMYLGQIGRLLRIKPVRPDQSNA